jgi:hypothetical protein
MSEPAIKPEEFRGNTPEERLAWLMSQPSWIDRRDIQRRREERLRRLGWTVGDRDGEAA